MKKFIPIISALVLSSTGAFAAQSVNMSDSLDKNITPASQETRKKVEKPRNLPDSMDRNTTPAPFEERQKEEEAMGSDSSMDSSSSSSKSDSSTKQQQ